MNNALQGSLGTSVVRTRQVPAFQPKRQGVQKRVIRVSAGLNREEEAKSEPGVAFVVSLGTLLAAAPALAEAGETALSSPPPFEYATPSVPPQAVDSAVDQIIAAVKAAGGTVKNGLDLAAQGAGKVKEAADIATPYVKKGVDVATPYVKATASLAQDVSKPIVNAAGPIFQNGLSEVEQFLSRQGLNAQQLVSGTREVTSKAEGAINYAAPTVKSTASTLSTSSPQALLQYGGIATGVYFLGPPVLRVLFGSFRGFAGQISPAAALDAASTDGNTVIIDIRSGNEKEYAGVPDLPKRDRLIELEFASVSDRRIRGQLRNVDNIEKQMTVLQIAALKKVKKGTKVLLMDKNGSVAKDVAKGLNSKGYKKVFVISGGFNGWTSSKLQTRGSSSVSSVEILGPIFGTRSSSSTRSSRALPSGR